MSFLYPWVFWLLLPAGWILLRRYRQRSRLSLPFPTARLPASLPPTRRTRLRHLPVMLRLAALTALVVALARPQTEKLESNLERDGIAIELLVDVSSSMDMRMGHQNRQVSRLDAAKDVIRQFVQGDEAGLSGRPNDLIGMITFARYADTICPLTHSHDALTFLTEGLTINDRPNEDGTAYGDATALAAARLSRLERRLERSRRAPGPDVKSKIIVLLTDGENNCGKILPLQAAALAEKWNIRIYTISLTDPPKTQFVRVEEDESIEAARTRSATERILEEMATSTGGIFRTAYDFGSLRDVYAEIDRLERTQMSATLRRIPVEQFHWFAIASLGLLAVELLIDSTWLRRIP